MPCCYVLFQNIQAVVALGREFTVYHLQLQKILLHAMQVLRKKSYFCVENKEIKSKSYYYED